MVNSLTDLSPKERSGIKGVARRVDSGEVSSFVQVILKGSLTLRIQDYVERQPMLSGYLRWVRFERLTFSRRT